MPVRRPAQTLAAFLLPVLIGVTGCAPEADPSAAPSTGTSASCSVADLDLITADTFTVGTDNPAYEPWFSDDEPSNGKGYESAVTYAVAEQLGFSTDQVTWITVPFTNAYAPGEKSFDVDVNQISITTARKQAVDFSSGYYDVSQSVVTTKGSSIAGATTIAALKDAKLGAVIGSTSYDAITDQIEPSAQPAPFDTNDLAIAALKNGQIDGIVADLPTAFYMTSAQLDDGAIVGQLPTPDNTTADQFGFVLDKGSSLTPCVSQAVDALRTDGTLATLQKTWLNNAGAPVLS